MWLGQIIVGAYNIDGNEIQPVVTVVTVCLSLLLQVDVLMTFTRRLGEIGYFADNFSGTGSSPFPLCVRLRSEISRVCLKQRLDEV